MSTLQVVRDGAAVAAELLALLFTTPAFATAGGPPSGAVEQRQLHAMQSAFGVRLLGSLAEFRIVQTVRNSDADRLDLAFHLPLADQRAESVAVSQQGSSIDLVHGDLIACGGEGDGDHDALEGHMQATLDEAIADLLQLHAGRRAIIAIEAIDTLERQAGAYRLTLPATAAPLPAQWFVAPEPDGDVLVLLLPSDVEGDALLTLRPDRGEPELISLGRVRGSTSAFVVPLEIAPRALQIGSVELEVVDGTRVIWTTVPPATTRDTTAERVVAHGALR